MIRRPPRSTLSSSSAASDVYKRQENDLFEADIHEATVVTLFLLPHINLKLRPKLLQDLKPGTRIVSNTFDMGDWKADKEVTVGNQDDEGFLSRRLYLWTVPARAPTG